MNETFLLFLLIGFFAQIIDGGIGMGFGVISNTVLLSMGIPPMISSGSVNTAGIFTSGVSAYSHYRFKNVEKKVFLQLVFTGVLGAIFGVFLLRFSPSEVLKPIIGVYLCFVGLSILKKATHKTREDELRNMIFPIRMIGKSCFAFLRLLHPKGKELEPLFVRFLGFLGGVVNAIGGGGWGPIVSSTLIVKGHIPRYSIGSSNCAEFFVSLTIAVCLLSFGSERDWMVVLGLLIGGVIAAPLAAYACKYLPRRTLLFIVGTLIVVLSLHSIMSLL